MSDAQQGLPRYSGRGHLAPVAGALNLHADCIELLDEGLSVHTGSGSYIKGAGGTAIGSPRRQRGTTQNNYGDCKRFALRIAKDTDDTLKLFIGKGGAQIDKPGSTARYGIAATTKTLVEDGIVYLKYNFVTGGTPSLQYGATPSCTIEEMIVRIGQTSKDETTGQWLLPEQWVVTDAFFFVGHGDGVGGGEIVTDSDGDSVVDPNGSPVKAFADDYSFRCRVAKDGTTWKIHISDGVVHGRLPVDHTPHEIPTTTLTLTGSDTHIYLHLLFSNSLPSGATFAYQYVTNASATYCPDQHSPITMSQTGLLAEDLNFAYTSALRSTNPNQYVTVLSGNTSYTGVSAIDDIAHPVEYENLLTFRIASIVWSNGVPSIRQRQLGDIYGTFRSML